MSSLDLDTLAALEMAASAAPWHVLSTNDSMCMSAVLVTKNPSTGREISIFEDGWIADDVVAACLVQHPEIAGSDDGRWHENARLIATVRNCLPELLHLARLGAAAEHAASSPRA
jgi:hypothetical protein